MYRRSSAAPSGSMPGQGAAGHGVDAEVEGVGNELRRALNLDDVGSRVEELDGRSKGCQGVYFFGCVEKRLGNAGHEHGIDDMGDAVGREIVCGLW